MAMAQHPKNVVFEIEVPIIYTDDLEDLREFKDEDETESNWLLNCLGDPGPTCRVRMETSGEKDSSVTEVWGLVRSAKLVEPSPSGNEAEMARLASVNLLRDEDPCEWCDCDLNLPEEPS